MKSQVIAQEGEYPILRTYYEPGLVLYFHFLDAKTNGKSKSLSHVAQLGNIGASFESSSPEIPLSHPMGHLQIQRESKFLVLLLYSDHSLNFSQKDT